MAVFTVAGGQWVAPPVVLLAHQRLLVAQPVTRVAAKRHSGADGEVLAVADPVDGDPRVEARVAVHGDACEGTRRDKVFSPKDETAATPECTAAFLPLTLV